MTFDQQTLPLLAEELQSLDEGFDHLPQTKTQFDLDRIRQAVLSDCRKDARRLPLS